MPSLVIPEQYRSGLLALRELSDTDTVRLIEALRDLPASAHTRADILAAVIPKLGDTFTRDQVERLIRALYSLYHVRALGDVLLGVFVGDLVEAMMTSGFPDLVLSGKEEQDRFVPKMNTLLGIESLTFLAKANALQRDHEHLFHDAKILTDLRPVFHEPDQEPVEMLLEYTLKIVFHDGSRHRELYMALDADDISRLRTVTERAEQKAASLKSMLRSKGLKHVPSLSEIG